MCHTLKFYCYKKWWPLIKLHLYFPYRFDRIFLYSKNSRQGHPKNKIKKRKIKIPVCHNIIRSCYSTKNSFICLYNSDSSFVFFWSKHSWYWSRHPSYGIQFAPLGMRIPWVGARNPGLSSLPGGKLLAGIFNPVGQAVQGAR